MPKKATVLDLALPERGARTCAYRWLYSSLRDEILSGRLRPGAQLPATRDLAHQYGLSRGTVVNAFELLKSEGYVKCSVGSGTFVSAILSDDVRPLKVSAAAQSPRRSTRMQRVSGYAKRALRFPVLEDRASYAFRLNLPALDTFPTALWAQITSRRLRRVSMSLLTGCDPMGYWPLRNAVAEYLTVSRGVNCRPEQVGIVSGVQEALDIVVRLVVDPGDRVCMEDPGYIGAARVFEAAGAKIRTVPLDDEGMKVIARRMRGARLVYVTPAHQYPLGVTMGLARRLELLEWTRASRAIIFEDDYDSEYRYRGRPVRALQGLDRDGLVIFAGSFNKVLFPSLRLGYVVVPPTLACQFEAARSVTSRHPPVLEQAVLCDFIAEGPFGRHLRHMREVYAERLSVLLESSRARLAGSIDISNIQAGLQTVGWLSCGIDSVDATAAAAKRNVEVTPLRAYAREHAISEALLFGFAAVNCDEIRRGVRDLEIALEGLISRRAT